MKNLSLLITMMLTLLMASALEARETRHLYQLSEALGNESAKEKLDGSVKFYFGPSGHPSVLKRYGEYMSNKKTNAFNKTDKHACEWSFLSAMLSFQQRAKGFGANAVINIKSYYKKNELNSTSEYECGAGGVIAGVTFKGDIVKLGQSQSQQSQAAPVTHSAPTQNIASTPAQSEKIRTAQNLLALLGYDPGSADGVMGDKTKNAIAEYQNQQGISITGALDRETLSRMGIK